MSDQRIGTCTVCLTEASLPYGRCPGGPRPAHLPWTDGRRLASGHSGGANPPVGPRRPWPGLDRRRGAATGPGPVPVATTPRGVAVGEPLGALAGLLAA